MKDMVAREPGAMNDFRDPTSTFKHYAALMRYGAQLAVNEALSRLGEWENH